MKIRIFLRTHTPKLGNTRESFMMDVLAPRIQPGMKVYEELHEDIFGE